MISASGLARLLGEPATNLPRHRWLTDALRTLIVDGRLPYGEPLPSERLLTAALGLSRTTVSRAYAQLRDAGYLTSRQGSGHAAALPRADASVGVRGAILPPSHGDASVIDLTCAAGRAPSGMAEAFAAALEALPNYLPSSGYATFGLPELRELIARRFTERGLPTDADQIMVTSGALAAVNIALRTLVASGRRVLVETPSYPNSIAAARRAGAQLTSIAVEPDGWDAEASSLVIASTRPAVAVLIPDFHNPTGSLMPDADRERLAFALRRAGTIPIVDETLVEVRLDAGPTPAPFGVHASRCITVGSASKSHWGGLRIGWLRAPEALLPRLRQARITEDLGAPIMEQLVLCELLRHDPGLHPDRHAALLASRAAMERALPDALPGATWRTPAGGLWLWVQLPGRTAGLLADAAEAEGLLITPGTQFAATHGHDRFVRLPVSEPAATITDAMGRLGRAARAAEAAPTRARRTPRRPLVA